jgi:DNA-binding PadR family transcriptional regulator
MKNIEKLLLAGAVAVGVRGKFGHRHDGGRHGFGARSGGFGGRWGSRTRRGEGKFLILEALADGPGHGYEIMTTIETRHGFRPSPGSIYPTLQMLDDGGFVTSAESDGKRVYTITDSGRALLATRADEPRDDDDDRTDDARQRATQSASKLMAAMMGARACDDVTLDKIREVIDRARRDIYAILASDET